MKKIILLGICLASAQLFAQDITKKQTLINSNLQSTGYGVLTSSYSSFNKKEALFTGAYGGWMINHKLMVGLGAFAMVAKNNEKVINPETNKRNDYQMGYGGLMVEYTFFGNSILHASANTLIGGGGITKGYFKKDDKNNDGDGKDQDWKSIDDSGFYVIQPSLNVEVNMTSWMRVAVGGGYRYITGSSLQGLTDKKMSAPTANLSLKFGKF